MAAVTLVNATTAGVNGTSWSQPIPLGVQAGDFLLLFVEATPSSSGSTITTPAGWTKVIDQPKGSGGDYVWMFTRVAVASTPAPTLTVNKSAPNVSTIVAARGVDASKVTQVYATGTVSNRQYPCPPLALAPAGTLVIRMACSSGSGVSFTWASPATELTDYNGGLAAAMTTSTETLAAAGTPAAVIATASTSNSGVSYATVSVALPPVLSRLSLGSTPVPLMLGSTEVEIKGP